MSSSKQSQTVTKSQLVQLYRQAIAAGLPLETVQQKIQTFAARSQVTLHVEEQDDRQRLQALRRRLPLRTRIIIHLLPVLFVGLGVFLVSNAAWPILSYFVFPQAEARIGGLLSPVSADALENPGSPFASTPVTTAVEQGPMVVEPIMLTQDLDYTNLNNWFPEMTEAQSLALQNSGAQLQAEEYVLDIPVVNIEDARVKIGGTDLDKSLIQYPGTAAPGDPGSPVIFGHSVLRQFYNPAVRNPRRYMSIFSKIMTLRTGDRIYVTSNGVRYAYEVTEKTEVKPTDTFILEQNFDTRTLKLVTCVPEGTYLRRGVVTARLVEGGAQ